MGDRVAKAPTFFDIAIHIVGSSEQLTMGTSGLANRGVAPARE
jgi:hypothetical protein